MKLLEKRLELKPSVDLSGFLPELLVRHAALGHAGDLWVLASDAADTRARVLRHKGGSPLTLDLAEPRGTPRRVAGLGKEETLTLSPDGQASLWDGRARLVGQFSLPGGVVALHAQAPGVFITHHEDGHVRQWSTQGTPLATHPGPYQACCVTSGEGLFLLGHGEAVSLVHGVAHASFKLPARAHALAVGSGHAVTVELRDQAPTLTLWALGKQRAQPVMVLLPQDAQGRPLDGPVSTRGGDLVLTQGPRVFRFTVDDVVNA
jgi:hypothetical protein